MNSGELARLAGVTVRALRHYHRVGVLGEPERLDNGYRVYDVHDLIRVLRIKRLASLGIPLAQMADLLDDTNDDTSDGAGRLLDELDAELAAQIERLTKQREAIARLRTHGARPDLPPELAPFLAVFAAADPSPHLARFDRDQTVLLAHIAGEAGTTRLARMYERLADPALAAPAADLSERFARLGPESSDEDVSALVESAVASFAPLFEEFAAADPALDIGGFEDLLNEHTADMLNARQRAALEELEARLAPSR